MSFFDSVRACRNHLTATGHHCRLVKHRDRLLIRQALETRSLQMPVMDGGGLIRLVLVGDVHRAWDPVFDATALDYLNPDAALFVGDFGEEVVDLVGGIAAAETPKAVMLGNHDAWGPLYLGQGLGKVQQQLDILANDHVAYGSKRFKAADGGHFSVVGGRPFSDGNSTIDHLTPVLYGPQNMQQSAHSIRDIIINQNKDDPVIVMAHNGPRGLGAKRHNPCGKDFRPEEGDYGDPDLRDALDQASASGRHPALVTFGHMHQSLHKGYGAGSRNMVHIDEDTGTVYLNCAVVPRHKRVPGRGNRLSHFVVVNLEGGVVLNAENVWLGQDERGETYVHKTETLIESQKQDGLLVRTVLFAFDGSHKQFRTSLNALSDISGKQEL